MKSFLVKDKDLEVLWISGTSADILETQVSMVSATIDLVYQAKGMVWKRIGVSLCGVGVMVYIYI